MFDHNSGLLTGKGNDSTPRKYRLYISLFIVVFVVSSIAITRTSYANFKGFSNDEELQLTSVNLDLWPEFDQTSMLVIYRITLPNEVFLPVEIKMRIPASSGKPNAVAVSQPGGVLMSIPYDIQPASEDSPEGDWLWLTFKAILPEIQVEYYDPELKKDFYSRHYLYVWPGDYAVDLFRIQVQEPVGTSEMEIQPGIVTQSLGADGLMYYTVEVGAVEKGETFEIEIDYQKDDERLSSVYVPIYPSGPLDDTTQGRMKINLALPWMLGLLGLLLIVGGGFWYWKSGHGASFSGGKLLPPVKRETPIEDVEENGENLYCSKCGNRASAGDRFCRTCGTQLITDR